MTSENKNATVNEFIRILFSLALATPREPMNVPVMAPPNTTILADFSDNANNTAKNNSSEEESGKGATSGSSTANGYTFRWSGGSGRAIITCQRIFEQNGQLYATIHFSRENGRASAYTQVRSLGQTVSGNNTFTIPVNKNANTTIQALTTAMSAPHWITYTIYVGEGGSTENSLTANTKQLDEKAPEITGLTVKGEVKITYSDKIKIFEYLFGLI